MLPNATRGCCPTGTDDGRVVLLLLMCLLVCAAAGIRGLLAACLVCTGPLPGEGGNPQ